jgi:hypothetical protein
MTNRFTRKLSYGKKILLSSAVIVAIAGPAVVGLLYPRQAGPSRRLARPRRRSR